MKYLLMAAILLAANTASAGEGGKLSKIKVPTERIGIALEVLQQNDLKTQIPAFAGHDLRMRKITFAPGDSLPVHSHAVRPGVVYVLEGEIVEGRGKTRKLYKAGDSWLEDAGTDHWLYNASDKPAVFLMIDTPVQK